MNGIRSNLTLVFEGLTALLLMGVSGQYLYSQIKYERAVQERLDRELQRLEAAEIGEGMLTELKSICEGVNLGHDNNQRLTFAVLDRLRARPEWFDSEQTKFSEGSELQPLDETEATYQVGITVRLASPVKFEQP